MRTRRRVALLAAALLLLAIASTAESATPLISPPLLAPASLPPQVRALEERMAALQVNSESFTHVIRGQVTIVAQHRGKHGKRSARRVHVPFSATQRGEGSLSPAAVRIFSGSQTRRPSQILIGSTVYLFSASTARRDGGRGWVRFKGLDVDVGAALPFDAEPNEVAAGGAGSFARLINLLATAVGPIGVAGPLTVDGQQATEITATVEPFRLIAGVPLSARAMFKKLFPPEKLEAFITEAGLPVRVVSTSVVTGFGTFADTTEILAVNVPVQIKPPPARETISEARYMKLKLARGQIVSVPIKSKQ